MTVPHHLPESARHTFWLQMQRVLCDYKKYCNSKGDKDNTNNNNKQEGHGALERSIEFLSRGEDVNHKI